MSGSPEQREKTDPSRTLCCVFSRHRQLTLCCHPGTGQGLQRATLLGSNTFGPGMFRLRLLPFRSHGWTRGLGHVLPFLIRTLPKATFRELLFLPQPLSSWLYSLLSFKSIKRTASALFSSLLRGNWKFTPTLSRSLSSALWRIVQKKRLSKPQAGLWDDIKVSGGCKAATCQEKTTSRSKSACPSFAIKVCH